MILIQRAFGKDMNTHGSTVILLILITKLMSPEQVQMIIEFMLMFHMNT